MGYRPRPGHGDGEESHSTQGRAEGAASSNKGGVVGEQVPSESVDAPSLSTF